MLCPACRASAPESVAVCPSCGWPFPWRGRLRPATALPVTSKLPMTPDIRVFLTDKALAERQHLLACLSVLGLLCLVSAAGYLRLLPGDQTFWLGTGAALTLLGLVPLSTFIAVKLWQERADLAESLYCQTTGRAILDERTDCEGARCCLVKLARLTLRFWMPSDELADFQALMESQGGTLTVEYTKHSHILLRMLDSFGTTVYLDPDYRLLP
jgi:hypothetical protein